MDRRPTHRVEPSRRNESRRRGDEQRKLASADRRRVLFRKSTVCRPVAVPWISLIIGKNCLAATLEFGCSTTLLNAAPAIRMTPMDHGLPIVGEFKVTPDSWRVAQTL